MKTLTFSGCRKKFLEQIPAGAAAFLRITHIPSGFYPKLPFFDILLDI